MTTFIYALKCPVSGNVRYVGKANNVKERYRNHLNPCKDKNTYKRNWINSLRRRNLRPIVEVVKEVPMDEWKKWERYFIKYYKDKGYDLVNCMDGGEGLDFGNQTSFKKGHISWNIGTRMKKPCVVCGKKFEVSPSREYVYKCCSAECRKIYVSKRLNKGTFKKRHTPWNKGKKQPKLNNKGNSKPVEQIDIVSGRTINIFPSAAEAERCLGVNQDSITNNTCGRSKSAGGYVWRKVS